MASSLQVSMAGESYPVYIGAGMLANVHSLIKGNSAAIVTNPCVGSLYAAAIVAELQSRNIVCHTLEIPDGEKFKTLETVSSIYDRLVAARVERGATLIALGGGVVGDMAGFVAATFLRGLDLVQVPTTLLAMVDSSIGGKVGVDHPRGKNLIGAWKMPRAVVSDTNTLSSLPESEWRAGMAEVAKHGIIADPEIFPILMSARVREQVEDWLARAIRVKADIVAADPFERGDRAKLNLGHTFGHALEQVSHYRLRHGDAVAIGLVCAARLSVLHGLADQETAARIESLIHHLQLPTRIPRQLAPDAILEAMETDKKRSNGHLRFVLPQRIGHVQVVNDIEERQVLQVLQELAER